MRNRLWALAIAGTVLLLDRITKAIVVDQISVYDTYTVIPGFFNLIHTENPGGAFSLLAGAQSEWRAFFLVGLSAATLALIAFLLWHPGGRLGDGRALRIGLSLLMGGALGNLWDRVLRGTVTDFLEFYIGSYSWPAFNVADIGISVGAALVILDMLRSRKRAVTT